MVGIALQPRSLFLFLVVWTSQHWILATGLGSQTPAGEPAPERGLIRRGLHSLNIRPWAMLLFRLIISALLLPLFDVEANRQPGECAGILLPRILLDPFRGPRIHFHGGTRRC